MKTFDYDPMEEMLDVVRLTAPAAQEGNFNEDGDWVESEEDREYQRNYLSLLRNGKKGKDFNESDFIEQYKESAYQIECSSATDFDIGFIFLAHEFADHNKIKLPVPTRN